MKKIKIILVFCAILLLNCKSVHVEKNKFSITAIKFMNSVNQYAIAINIVTFWQVGEDELAKLDFPLNRHPDFFEIVKEMPQTTSDEFGVLTYAFILKNGNKSTNDTIYADHELNTWIVKKDRKLIYHQDVDGEFSNYMKSVYSFFYECW